MIFMILAASDALDGTFAGYRPPTFHVWERGAWERGSWGMNDEWLPAGGGGGGGVVDLFLRRRRRSWEPRA